jgi:hypothetical protein
MFTTATVRFFFSFAVLAEISECTKRFEEVLVSRFAKKFSPFVVQGNLLLC